MSAIEPRHEHDRDDDDDDVEPACPISEQCSERDFERKSRSKLGVFFEPCGNSECFGGDDDVAGDADVVIARGRSTGSFHRVRL
jgi:hypothetical protein